MTERPGYELPLLLLGAFRQTIETLHETLAERGFPEARPAHGLALQAIGPDAVTVSELGRRLGVSKQAAAKTVSRLEAIGYVTRQRDPHDARAQLVFRSARGNAMLLETARILEDQKAALVATLGAERYGATVDGLRQIAKGASLVDVLAWLQDD